MGTYDTRGGSPISPAEPDFAPSKLVEDVLAILETAGAPTAVSDKVVALIETAEAAFASSPSQPAGWKLVPVEPTPEMRAAAFNAASELRRERHGPQQGIHPDFEDAYWKDHETAWKAMLAAAPALVEPKKED